MVAYLADGLTFEDCQTEDCHTLGPQFVLLLYACVCASSICSQNVLLDQAYGSWHLMLLDLYNILTVIACTMTACAMAQDGPRWPWLAQSGPL